MFDQLFKDPKAIARHLNGPYAPERQRYLTAGMQQGKAHCTLRLDSEDLLWTARQLSIYPNLCKLTLAQVRARTKGKRRQPQFAVAWLRFLGYLPVPVEPIPFREQLERYCRWCREERGFTEATIHYAHECVRRFLCWYGPFKRDFAQIRIEDIDAYLRHGSDHGWCRITVGNVARKLRAFFRFCAEQHWIDACLPEGICGPRVYAQEGLPAGPDWSVVRRMLAGLDMQRPVDVRARPILMLMAIYGLRASEVGKLRLEQVDWAHDQLHVMRAKRRTAQTYPLLPSVGNAILQYLKKVRPRCAHREVFLTLQAPYQPMSGGALYHAASPRLLALGVRTAHHGPHSLRHACAMRLLADGLSLKAIGDHLGHRSPSATATYAKVDLRGLREVAAFDLGELP